MIVLLFLLVIVTVHGISIALATPEMASLLFVINTCAQMASLLFVINACAQMAACVLSVAGLGDVYPSRCPGPLQ